MSTQHTPGPWAFVDHSWCDKSVYASLHQNDEKRICALHLSEDADESEEATEIANARLIAAAPELLRELLQLAEYAERLGARVPGARAAIAKATGSAS